ncbi:WRKY DNA-binding transcription factor 70-like [Neltuma alba]|uniref:WRKY DNA-binding transcription factor 70-like n=1 Tax=Neltuma alba TaxID=207710 RepID=UPI0010A3EAD4|nr:WRKY DNA-binding transcription factor 70-like [Prosopis alba]XP_028781977.1 WRKY DNA-binding transcription factor 70-like [Prosopis alba]
MENLAMKVLERGREYANQIQRFIRESDNGEDDEDEALTTSYARDLAAKMGDSLKRAILLLNNNQDSAVNSEESHESSKSRSQTMKDPIRFSPRKRKSVQTWEEYTKIPKEDGYAWRKYGEKIILNAK